MARVTVEDCVEKVPNRFELVLLATVRARELASGAQPSVSRDNDKNPVIALREIAEEGVCVNDLSKRAVATLLQEKCVFSSAETHDAAVSQLMKNEATSYLQEEAFEEGVGIFAGEDAMDTDDEEETVPEQEEENSDSMDTDDDEPAQDPA